jgi:cytosine/creatinine deaminase
VILLEVTILGFLGCLSPLGPLDESHKFGFVGVLMLLYAVDIGWILVIQVCERRSKSDDKTKERQKKPLARWHIVGFLCLTLICLLSSIAARWMSKTDNQAWIWPLICCLTFIALAVYELYEFLRGRKWASWRWPWPWGALNLCLLLFTAVLWLVYGGVDSQSALWYLASVNGILAFIIDVTLSLPALLGDPMDEFLQAAFEEAKKGLAAGGIPIGSVLVVNGKIIGRGHNQRVQRGSAIRHAEMDCLENAGRLPASQYKLATLYSTLSPCDMCSGAVLLYKIPRVIIGENKTFRGPEDYLRSRGVEVEVVNSSECIQLMKQFISDDPLLWNEDIGV